MDLQAASIVREAGGVVQDGVAQRMCDEAHRNNVALFELLHGVNVDIYCRVSFLCYVFGARQLYTVSVCMGAIMVSERHSFGCDVSHRYRHGVPCRTLMAGHLST